MRFYWQECTYKDGHSDPDNSGLCIHCAAILDVLPGDLEDAEKEGIPIPYSARELLATKLALRPK